MNLISALSTHYAYGHYNPVFGSCNKVTYFTGTTRVGYAYVGFVMIMLAPFCSTRQTR